MGSCCQLVLESKASRTSGSSLEAPIQVVIIGIRTYSLEGKMRIRPGQPRVQVVWKERPQPPSFLCGLRGNPVLPERRELCGPEKIGTGLLQWNLGRRCHSTSSSRRKESSQVDVSTLACVLTVFSAKGFRNKNPGYPGSWRLTIETKIAKVLSCVSLQWVALVQRRLSEH